jgi:D-glycerate 3-kinase
MHPLARALHARVPHPSRVDDYYAPLAVGCAARALRAARRPFVLGIQGPQGCGKSTLASALVHALGDAGLRSVALSIDDFYLTREEQLALAARHPGNRYLEHRGYPGTHDVLLGSTTLTRLRALGPGEEARVPSYDKSAHEGRGDRAPASSFRAVVGPLDLVVVEGWMLGFSPAARAPGEVLDADLRDADAYLGAYAAWTSELDALLHLDVASLESIVAFRVDAERARRARGEPSLSDEDARDYIERFLPAYRLYVPALRERPPCADFHRVRIGEDRMPVEPAALSAWSDGATFPR